MIIKNIKLTQSNLREFHSFLQKDKSADSTKMKRKSRYLKAGSFGILCLIAFYFFQDSCFYFDFKTAILVSAIFITYIFIYFVSLMVLRARMAPAQDGIVYRSHDLEINDTEIISTSEIHQTRFSLKSITKIVRTKNLLLIFYEKTMATMIPLEMFKDEAQLQECIDLVEKLNDLN